MKEHSKRVEEELEEEGGEEEFRVERIVALAMMLFLTKPQP